MSTPRIDLRTRLSVLAELDVRSIRADVITTRVTIPASSAITQPQQIKLEDDFWYLMSEVRAGATVDTTSDATLNDFDQIRFNIRRSDTKRNLWSTDLELATLVSSRRGKGLPANPGGWMLLSPGIYLQPTFTRRADIDTVAGRVVAVELVFQLLSKKWVPTVSISHSAAA